MSNIIGSKADHREQDYRFLRRSSPGSWNHSEPVTSWGRDLLDAIGLVIFIAVAFWLLGII